MNETPPPLDPPPSTQQTNAAPERTELVPTWLAILAALLFGGIHLALSAPRIRAEGGGVGYSMGALIGTMLVAPIVAGIVAAAARPLRSFGGFCVVYASLSALLGLSAAFK
jgi:hypothetical protein